MEATFIWFVFTKRVFTRGETVCRNRNTLAIYPQETQSNISVLILATRGEANIGPACIAPILSPFAGSKMMLQVSLKSVAMLLEIIYIKLVGHWLQIRDNIFHSRHSCMLHAAQVTQVQY